MSSVKIQGSATGTANFTIAVPDGTSTDRTITLPDAAGSFVLADGSGDVAVSGVQIRKDTASTTNELLRLTNANGSTTDGVKVTMEVANTSGNGGEIGVVRDGGSFNPYMYFSTSSGVGSAPTERARLTNDGNLLVGKTALNTAANGGELRANGQLLAIATDINPFFAARLNSDGDLFVFRKDATTVGNIGTQGGEPYIGLGDVAIKFHPGLDAIMPWSIDTNSWRDNAISLGRPTAYRFDDAYITNGVTTGSDGNEKQDIAELDEAEKRVALAAKSLVRKYRWIDAVEKKGDDARIHVGVIAQDLKAAFEAEGLDAHRYGMFMSNTYWMADETIPAVEEELDEEGNVITEAKPERIVQRVYEGDQEVPEGATEHVRLGVRYPELLAFIIGAM